MTGNYSCASDIANHFLSSYRRDLPTALSLNSSNMSPSIPPILRTSRSPSCIKRSLLGRACATQIRNLLKSQGASRSQSQGLHGSARSPKTSRRRNVPRKKGTRTLLHQWPGVLCCHPVIMWPWLRKATLTSEKLVKRKAQVLFHRCASVGRSFP